MLRISLIIAVIAGLAVAGLNIALVKDKITVLVKDRDDQKDNRKKAEDGWNAAKKDLTATKTKLAATEENLKTTTEAKDRAEASAADFEKKNLVLTDTLNKTKGDLDNSRNELAAWKALGATVEVVSARLKEYNKVVGERDNFATDNKVLLGKVRNLTAEINELKDPETDGPLMTVGLKGKVVAADPKYDFVVLDIGQTQGVVQYGRFLVNRNGKLVAKLKVQSVEANRCIANVMPGWKLGEVVEGDQVIY